MWLISDKRKGRSIRRKENKRKKTGKILSCFRILSKWKRRGSSNIPQLAVRQARLESWERDLV